MQSIACLKYHAVFYFRKFTKRVYFKKKRKKKNLCAPFTSHVLSKFVFFKYKWSVSSLQASCEKGFPWNNPCLGVALWTRPSSMMCLLLIPLEYLSFHLGGTDLPRRCATCPGVLIGIVYRTVEFLPGLDPDLSFAEVVQFYTPTRG